MVTPATKKSCPKESSDTPVEEVPPAPVLPLDTAGSWNIPPAVSTVWEEAQPAQDPSPSDSEPANPGPTPEEEDKKEAAPCEEPPTWEEMKEMLERTPCFTDPEPPPTKLSDFFPPTIRLSPNMGGDPSFFVTARLPFGTPESAIARIQPLQECTPRETAEVVIPFTF